MDEGQIENDQESMRSMTPTERAEEFFAQFISPLTAVADTMIQAALYDDAPRSSARISSMHLDLSKLRRDDFRVPLIGLCRDLRGVAGSCEVSREYELLFAWLFPSRMALLTAAAGAWADDPGVMTPLLKLVAELSNNRGSRIMFPASSSAGQVLFMESARALMNFSLPQVASLEERRKRAGASDEHGADTAIGSGLTAAASVDLNNPSEDHMSMSALRSVILEMNSTVRASGDARRRRAAQQSTTVELPPGTTGRGITVDMNERELKGVAIVVLCLSRLIGGRYTNLGSFAVYGDSCYDDVTRLTLELALVNSPQHLFQHYKVSKALVILLNSLSERKIMSIVELPIAHVCADPGLPRRGPQRGRHSAFDARGTRC